MKKAAKFLLQFIIVMGLITVFTSVNAAFASLVPMGGEVERKAYKSASLPLPPANQGADEILKLVMDSGLAYTKVIVVAVGILYITVMGYRMVTNSENEEELTNIKKGMTYTLIAFMIISMSQDVAQIFNFVDASDKTRSILQNPSTILSKVVIWNKQVQIVITFIKYILASFAGVMIVRSSIKLVTSGGNDEEVSKHRHSILYSIAGLLLVYGGDIFINKVFYVVNTKSYTPTDGIKWSVDAGQGVKELVGITNMIVSFVGPVAILMLIVAAIMYLAAGGKDENMQKAKRIIVATVIGIVIIYGAFALVNTVVLGKLSTTEAVEAPPTE
jgi:heme/copper-type cytochrome/quinol oxidase subunit 2